MQQPKRFKALNVTSWALAASSTSVQTLLHVALAYGSM
jgi:hypothetical protein